MSYTNIEIKKKENAQIEITGEILADQLTKYREKALKNVSENVNLKGFRKGKIPEDVLIKNVGEMSILQEMAELALSDQYPKIILEEKINPLGHPQVSITKLAPKENLGFKIVTATMPEVTLPDYKTIAKKIAEEKDEDTEVTDKNLESTIETLRKQRATQTAQKGAGGQADKDKQELPEFNDEFVKTLGDFKDVEDFRNKLRENLKLEKERMAKEKRRNKLADSIIEKSEIDLPQLLIDGELQRMLGQFRADIEQAGLTYDKYLEEVKKTDEDIKKEWTPIAEKKAKLQLVLNKIALEEKVTPEEDQVQKEIEHILSHQKDAPEDRVRTFVETMLTNEKVFEFLEGKKK